MWVLPYVGVGLGGRWGRGQLLSSKEGVATFDPTGGDQNSLLEGGGRGGIKEIFFLKFKKTT